MKTTKEIIEMIAKMTQMSEAGKQRSFNHVDIIENMGYVDETENIMEQVRSLKTKEAYNFHSGMFNTSLFRFYINTEQKIITIYAYRHETDFEIEFLETLTDMKHYPVTYLVGQAGRWDEW